MPPTSQRPLRRDAQRNRDALLAAAGETFAQEGIEASLEAVAKRAQVAIGTLYRHFPTRVDLIEAIFAEKVQAWVTAAERALEAENGWDGFVGFLEAMCQLQAEDRGLVELAAMRLPAAPRTEAARRRMFELTDQILNRAQAEGSLRPDVTAEDLAFVMWSNGRVAEVTGPVTPRAWRRHLALVLDGFRADAARPLPEPPMRPAAVYRAMRSLGTSACSGQRDRDG